MSDSLDTLNSLSAAELRARLTLVLDVPSWVDAVIAGRPYRSRHEVLSRAGETPWSESEILTAVAGRPRLGGPIPKSNTYSPSEQAGVLADEPRRTEMQALATAYEARHGVSFLVRAEGRSAADVRVALLRRMNNDLGTEIAEIQRELREITLLRLGRLIDDLDPA